MSRAQLGLLVLLGGIWGASFMFIKIVGRELEPSALTFGRLALAAVALAAVGLAQGPAGELVASLRRCAFAYLVLGALTALPFWLIAWAETEIDSGLAAILQASAPLFTALLAWRFLGGERIGRAHVAGLVVGFGGVALLVGGASGGSVLHSLAVVGAALAYSLAAVWSRLRLRGQTPLTISLGGIGAATLLAAPAGIAELPADVPGWETLGALVLLAILSSALANVLYFRILLSVGASRAMLVTYLVPAAAVVYGVAILGEPLLLRAVAGLALVLTGVALGTGGIAFVRRVAASEAGQGVAAAPDTPARR